MQKSLSSINLKKHFRNRHSELETVDCFQKISISFRESEVRSSSFHSWRTWLSSSAHRWMVNVVKSLIASTIKIEAFVDSSKVSAWDSRKTGVFTSEEFGFPEDLRSADLRLPAGIPPVEVVGFHIRIGPWEYRCVYHPLDFRSVFGVFCLLEVL